MEHEEKKFIDALNQFNKSAWVLLAKWENLNSDYYELTDGGKYPFKMSFDELCYDVTEWVDDLYQKFNKLDSGK